MLKQTVRTLVKRLLPGTTRASLATSLIQSLDGDASRNVHRWLSMTSDVYCFSELKRRGVDLGRIVDVGAYEGHWTRMIKQQFPQADVLMVEPLRAKQANLERLIDEYPGTVQLASEVIGEADNKWIEFNEAETGSSVLCDVSGSPAAIATPCRRKLRTLDSLLAEKSFSPVDLLKLDVQGYELQVLAGARETLADTSFVLVEASLQRLYEDSPLVADVLARMESLNFQLYDITELHRRPLDGATAQADLLFVRKQSPLVAHEGWS